MRKPLGMAKRLRTPEAALDDYELLKAYGNALIDKDLGRMGVIQEEAEYRVARRRFVTAINRWGRAMVVLSAIAYFVLAR